MAGIPSSMMLSSELLEVCAKARATHSAVTLTTDGRPEFVLQEASEYQRLLDLAALADATEGIRQGMLEAELGLTCPAEKVLDAMRERYGISR